MDNELININNEEIKILSENCKIEKKIFKSKYDLDLFLKYHPSCKFIMNKKEDKSIECNFYMKKIILPNSIGNFYSYDHNEKDCIKTLTNLQSLFNKK